jgi:acyl-coenzyme A thioesterase PaaI-like protein
MTTLRQRWLRRLVNLWPPYLGAGIRVTRMSGDMKEVDVEMRLHFWNANYVGTHFGGSLYSMTDPFYMLMLLTNLGPEYVVWDKASTIRYRKPGRGRVRAEFRLSEGQIEEIRETLRSQEKHEPVFRVEVRDEQGDVVAEVDKTLSVRRRAAR